MSDAYCRSCHASFPRPLPAPYGAICPNCVARGEIVTLTDLPRAAGIRRERIRGNAARRPSQRATNLSR